MGEAAGDHEEQEALMGEASGDHDSDDDGSSSAVQDAPSPCDFASEADVSALLRRARKKGHFETCHGILEDPCSRQEALRRLGRQMCAG